MPECCDAKLLQGLVRQARKASLPPTPALRREQIKLQVGLANALYHSKGVAAAETIAAFNQGRVMIEQAESLGEPIEDPLLLYSVLYGFFIAKFINFDGDAASALARQFLALAEQQKATAPIMVGHRLLGMTLLVMGDAAEALSHLDRAWALYDPVAHRPLATRFGQDVGATTLTFRPLALWSLGYPETALGETEHAITAARETDHMPTLLFALSCTAFTHICCRDAAAAAIHLDECIALAQEKVPFFKLFAGGQRGCVSALTGKVADAIQAINAGIAGLRATGATTWGTAWLSHLALAYAALGKLDDAWRCIGEAMTLVETGKERWYEAELNRVAGEISLMSPEPDPAKAQEHFERALAVARQQRAKSWELRAAMSLARLWRSQGKMSQARELLGPVYVWFTKASIGSICRRLRPCSTIWRELGGYPRLQIRPPQRVSRRPLPLKQFRDQISARHGNSAGRLQGITIGENAKGTVQRNLTINCRNGIVISKNNEGNICYNITAGELSAEQIKEAAQYLSSAPQCEFTK